MEITLKIKIFKIELGELKRKLESGQISVSSLNIFEVMELIDSYQNQSYN